MTAEVATADVATKDLLSVRAGRAGYDGRREVISEIELQVLPGEVVAVLGANGAGKSTLFRALMGLCRWQAGSLTLSGKEISKLSPRRRVALGMALVPQGHELFPSLTVEENLRAGGLARARSQVADGIERVYAEFPKLFERRQQTATTLSGGERALLAIGRAMVSSPQFLLLDEPSLGLSAGARQGVFGHLRRLCETSGLTVLLAEQDATSSIRIADTCYGMRNGTTVGWLRADDLSDPRLRELYLTGVSGPWGQTDRRG